MQIEKPKWKKNVGIFYFVLFLPASDDFNIVAGSQFWNRKPMWNICGRLFYTRHPIPGRSFTKVLWRRPSTEISFAKGKLRCNCMEVETADWFVLYGESRGKNGRRSVRFGDLENHEKRGHMRTMTQGTTTPFLSWSIEDDGYDQQRPNCVRRTGTKRGPRFSVCSFVLVSIFVGFGVMQGNGYVTYVGSSSLCGAFWLVHVSVESMSLPNVGK